MTPKKSYESESRTFESFRARQSGQELRPSEATPRFKMSRSEVAALGFQTASRPSFKAAPLRSPDLTHDRRAGWTVTALLVEASSLGRQRSGLRIHTAPFRRLAAPLIIFGQGCGGCVDTLSELLSVLRPRVQGAGGFDLADDRAVAFGDYVGIKCYAVAQGACWLVMAGETAPLRLSEGDCVLLPHGRAFRLGFAPSLPTVGYAELERRGDVRVLGGGGRCFVAGGHFALDGEAARRLLTVLPSVVHVEGQVDREALGWSIGRMRQELVDDRPGASLVSRHLAHMMLVQAFRLYLTEADQGRTGVLFALADPQLGRALAAIHGDPARNWTVEELARIAGASRSGFAQRFAVRVGQPPIDYAVRWRMTLAAERLAEGREPVSSIARSLGYEADNAFGAAFRRVMGRSPRDYGRAMRLAEAGGAPSGRSALQGSRPT